MGLFTDHQATVKISKDYGVRAVPCGQSRYQFGHNPDLDAGGFEQVWHYGGIEVLPTANTIDTISSSDAGDTAVLLIEGKILNADGGVESLTQTATLDGQNKVVLTTPLYRMGVAYNNNGTEYLGDVYIYEDDTIVLGVPQTPAKVHGFVLIGDNQTANSLLTVNYDTYLIVNQLVVSVGSKVNAATEFAIQLKLQNGVWRTVYNVGIGADGGSFEFDFTVPFILPPNSDLRILVETLANNVAAYAVVGADCFLVV
jgi:hypothetical protein